MQSQGVKHISLFATVLLWSRGAGFFAIAADKGVSQGSQKGTGGLKQSHTAKALGTSVAKKISPKYFRHANKHNQTLRIICCRNDLESGSLLLANDNRGTESGSTSKGGPVLRAFEIHSLGGPFSGWRPSITLLLGWRPSLVGWRPSLGLAEPSHAENNDGESNKRTSEQ